MGWIEIVQGNEHTLPDLEKEVLIFDHWKTTDGEYRKDIRVGYLSSFTTYKSSSGTSYNCEWAGSEFIFNITHWMPLPEHPKVNPINS